MYVFLWRCHCLHNNVRIPYNHVFISAIEHIVQEFVMGFVSSRLDSIIKAIDFIVGSEWMFNRQKRGEGRGWSKIELKRGERLGEYNRHSTHRTSFTIHTLSILLNLRSVYYFFVPFFRYCIDARTTQYYLPSLATTICLILYLYVYYIISYTRLLCMSLWGVRWPIASHEALW